jgi:hypothetical protein
MGNTSGAAQLRKMRRKMWGIDRIATTGREWQPHPLTHWQVCHKMMCKESKDHVI